MPFSSKLSCKLLYAANLIIGALEELQVTDVRALGRTKRDMYNFLFWNWWGGTCRASGKEGGPGLLRGDQLQGQWRSRVSGGEGRRKWQQRRGLYRWLDKNRGRSSIHPRHRFLKTFLMWAISKTFIEIVTILLLFYVLVFQSRGVWNLSSPLWTEPAHSLHWKVKS